MRFFKNIFEKFSLMFTWKTNRQHAHNIKNVTRQKNIVSEEQQVMKNNQGQNITQVNSPTYNIIVAFQEEVAEKLLTSVFGELPEDTKKQIRLNQNSYINCLIGELKKISINQEELERIVTSPDFQYTAKQSCINASKTSDVTLHKILSGLLKGRILGDGLELKKIVYNEAIRTIEKLTANQLKILTLCYLLKYTTQLSISNWQQFNYYLVKCIQPFLDFKNTNAEFQHLEYAGCGSMQPLIMCDLAEEFKKAYSFLFIKNPEIKKSDIASLQLTDEIKNNFISPSPQTQELYIIKVRNMLDLHKYFETHPADQKHEQQLINLYNKTLLPNKDIEEIISTQSDVGKRLFSIIKHPSNNLLSLNLTSVGIVVAASNFELVTGSKINIDIWIN